MAAVAGTLPSREMPICNKPLQWEKDSKRKWCIACGQEFSLFIRKHHCRACGKIFCDSCTSEQILVHGYSGPQRTCYFCYVEYAPISNAEQTVIDKMIEKNSENLLVTQQLIRREAKARTKGIIIVGHSLVMGVQRGGSKALFKKCHIIDLISIKTPAKRKLLQLEFGYLTKQEITLLFETSKPALIIQALREAHRDLTIGSPINLILEVPEDKLLPLRDHGATKAIAGGFLLHYKAMCSFYKIIPSNDVIQFIESLYRNETKEINFFDCPGIEADTPISFDVRPVFQALSFNNYFKSITFCDLNRKGLSQEICSLFKRNGSITRLKLERLTSGLSQLPHLGNALQSNPGNALVDLIIKDINLSSSIVTLANAMASMAHGFRIIRFINCRLQGKHITTFFRDGLMKNYPLSLTLEELNFSGNKFEVEGSEILQKFFLRIGPYSNLKRLILRNCYLNILLVLRPLHSFPNLNDIDISHNKLELGSTQLLCSVLEHSKTIKTLSLTGCSLNSSLFEPITNAIQSNTHLHALKVVFADNVISDNSMGIITKHLCQKETLLHTIDLSHTKLTENGFIMFCSALQKLQNVILDKIIIKSVKFENVSQKTGEMMSTSLYYLLKTHDSIRSIVLSGGYSNFILLPFLNKLCDIDSLLELDISNNKLGDLGASCIANLIRSNPNIASIRCDSNHFQLAGLQSLCLSVCASKTIQFFDFQWDFTSKINPSLVYPLLMKMESAVAVNRSNSLHPRFTDTKDDFCISVIPLAILPQEFLDTLNDENQNDSSLNGGIEQPKVDAPVLPIEAFSSLNTTTTSNNNSINLDKSDEYIVPPVINNPPPPQQKKQQSSSSLLGEPPLPHNYTASKFFFFNYFVFIFY